MAYVVMALFSYGLKIANQVTYSKLCEAFENLKLKTEEADVKEFRDIKMSDGELEEEEEEAAIQQADHSSSKDASGASKEKNFLDKLREIHQKIKAAGGPLPFCQNGVSKRKYPKFCRKVL